MYILNFIFIFAFGLIIGSFLNCFIWRLHKNETLLGRSYCPRCLKKISWFDNIPVFSFLVLLGKCRKCKKAISLQYPIVEFIVGALFLLIFKYRSLGFEVLDTWQLWQHVLLLLRDWFMISVMTVIFVYDLKWYLILDKVTLPSAAIFFVVNLILGVSIFDLVLCGLVGAGFFLTQFLISNGKWIGGGDIRLGLLMGVFFGRLDYLILAIMIAYFIGSAIGIAMIIFGKKKWRSKVPLGTFLTVSTIITTLWADLILEWYWGLF